MEHLSINNDNEQMGIPIIDEEHIIQKAQQIEKIIVIIHHHKFHLDQVKSTIEFIFIEKKPLFIS
jgi:hypothetical protein